MTRRGFCQTTLNFLLVWLLKPSPRRRPFASTLSSCLPVPSTVVMQCHKLHVFRLTNSYGDSQFLIHWRITKTVSQVVRNLSAILAFGHWKRLPHHWGPPLLGFFVIACMKGQNSLAGIGIPLRVVAATKCVHKRKLHARQTLPCTAYGSTFFWSHLLHIW